MISTTSQPIVSSDRRPRLAITVGDAAGVGIELALTVAADSSINRLVLPIVYGPAEIIHAVSRRLDRPPPANMIDVGILSESDVRPGHSTAATGLASFEAVETSISDAMSGQIDGIVTGPIQKESWAAAEVPFVGHTELLADRCGCPRVAMMLTAEAISCVLATIHVPLADVADRLTQDDIVRAIRLTADALWRRHDRRPRITVCGLNPHAGEGGLLSHGEEERIIAPAMAACADVDADLLGPVPPDTAFTPAMRSRTDAYVAMYHDQGLIPLKALAFDDAVNVTLGLPIVRTSVDHGTALDLAWRGIAKPDSFLAATRMAARLATRSSGRS